MATTSQLQFGNLIDLANRDFGGKVLEASDDFFSRQRTISLTRMRLSGMPTDTPMTVSGWMAGKVAAKEARVTTGVSLSLGCQDR